MFLSKFYNTFSTSCSIVCSFVVFSLMLDTIKEKNKTKTVLKPNSRTSPSLRDIENHSGDFRNSA